MSEYTPITGELRERIGQAEHIIPLSDDSKDMQVRINLAWLTEKLNAIDSIHAQLEREYDELRMKYVNMNRHAQHVERENAALKAELDRVLGEQNEERHTVGESITGELREVAAKTECANGRCEKLYRGDLDHIADRIDAEHESACAETYGNGVESVALPDMTAYVKLPKDADGVPIRVGDTVECVDDTLAPRNVTSTDLAGDGWWVYINGIGRRPDRYRHVTPDSWERIIEDALDGYHDTDFDALVARCKALCERTKGDE